MQRPSLTTAATLLALALLGGCATRAAAPASVAQALERTPQTSTFNALVAQAGMGTTLASAGPMTVFAPSDAAFKALPEKTLAALKSDPAQLKALVSYHIVAERIVAADAKAGKVKSVEGTPLALSKAGSYMIIEDAMVEQADIRAGNGVVQVIDRVLVPPRKK